MDKPEKHYAKGQKPVIKSMYGMIPLLQNAPEQAHPSRQEVDQWLPGAGVGGGRVTANG